MRLKIFGVGAAGNKATINLIEKQVVDRRDCVLINSTIKDIPYDYRDYVIRLSDEVQGCGQERALAKDICLQAIKSGRLNLDSIVDPEYDKVVVITSTSGGTGSGASVIIAQYFKQVMKMEVEVIGLVGFEDESARSLRNLIEFCQDLNEKYAIQLIRNSAYLQSARGNRSLAEQMVNDNLASRIMVMQGSLLRDSEQNIDDTDIKKLNNTPGYKTVEYVEIEDKIKNVQQFNDMINEMLDDSPSIDADSATSGRFGIMINAHPSSLQQMDWSFKILKERLGMPYEVYQHIENVEDLPQFIAVIASGMKMPTGAIENTFKKYSELNASVNKDKDSFFDTVKSFQGSEDDSMFDVFSSSSSSSVNDHEMAKNNFFAEYNYKVSSAPKATNHPAKNDKRNTPSNNAGY